MAANGVAGVSNFDSLSGNAVFVGNAIAATGAPQVVAHGLPVTPNRVFPSIQSGHDGMGAAGTLQGTITVGAITATTITVTCTAGCTFGLWAM